MRITACFLTALALASGAAAQSAPAATPVSALNVNADTYQYQNDGRRDPFTSLLHSGNETAVTGKRGDGLAGFTIGEISVRGVMQSRRTLVAMVQGPDNKTYLIHQGDKLADAVVKNVTTEGLVVMQDVSDPLSTHKQREVRKLLRSLEGAK